MSAVWQGDSCPPGTPGHGVGSDREAHSFQAQQIQSLCISVFCGSGKIKNEEMLWGHV